METPPLSNPFIDTRRLAEQATDDPKQRNLLWWERMPMTYFDWSAAERMPKGADDFVTMRACLLENSPFLREIYDFSTVNGRSVLDLGCGAGVLSYLLDRAGGKVSALDLSQNAVRLTREMAATYGLPISVVRGDAEGLPCADGVFDYVFSWGVLHHTPDTEQAFREVARVLRPGGAGLIMVYHKLSVVYYLFGLYMLFIKGKIFRGHTLESVQGFYTDGYFHRHFRRSEFHRALTEAGLTVRSITVTQMEKKILPGIPRFLDRWLKDRVGWLIIAEFKRPA